MRDVREDLESKARTNVFNFCGGNVDGNGKGAVLEIGGERYDNFSDIPDEQLVCERNGVKVDFSGGALTLSDEEDSYEVEEFGTSYSMDDRLSVVGTEKNYSVDEDGLHKSGVTYGAIEAPEKASDDLRSECEKLVDRGGIGPFNVEQDRPVEACYIDDAGGRGRVIFDGENLNEIEDGQTKVVFGKIRGTDSDGRSVERKQGEFVANDVPQVGGGSATSVDVAWGEVEGDKDR